MKTRITLLLVAVFAVVLTLGSTAQAVTVYTDDTGANDLGLNYVQPHDLIGPGGLGDATPFGPGLWEMTGSFGGADDGDGHQFTVAAGNTFDWSYSATGGGVFSRWGTGTSGWSTGDIAFDENNFTVTDLAAGTYSGGIGDNAGGTWTWSISVSAVPEPSTFALAGIGAAAFGFVGWRKRRSLKKA